MGFFVIKLLAIYSLTNYCEPFTNTKITLNKILNPKKQGLLAIALMLWSRAGTDQNEYAAVLKLVKTNFVVALLVETTRIRILSTTAPE